jgi:hypothetical protein
LIRHIFDEHLLNNQYIILKWIVTRIIASWSTSFSSNKLLNLECTSLSWDNFSDNYWLLISTIQFISWVSAFFVKCYSKMCYEKTSHGDLRLYFSLSITSATPKTSTNDKMKMWCARGTAPRFETWMYTLDGDSNLVEYTQNFSNSTDIMRIILKFVL